MQRVKHVKQTISSNNNAAPFLFFSLLVNDANVKLFQLISSSIKWKRTSYQTEASALLPNVSRGSALMLTG